MYTAKVENYNLAGNQVTGANLTTSNCLNSTNFSKLALKYKENDFSAWVNGFEVLTGASGLTFSSETLNTIDFSRSDDTNHFYGKTKELGYYDTALTDEELEYMTSYRTLRRMAEELNLNKL